MEVVLVGHHLLQVVVVSHADGHVVRVGLAQLGLGIVGNVVAVLIPVERGRGGHVFHTVDMALGVALAFEELPSTTKRLVGLRVYMGVFHGNGSAGQHQVGRQDVVHDGYATLEYQVDVHHMALADGRDVVARSIALLVVVLIDDGDDLLL